MHCGQAWLRWKMSAALAAGLAVGVAGCGTVIQPLEEIPALVARTLDDSDTYCTDIPASTTGLQPVDEEREVAGCWATCGDVASTTGFTSTFVQALQINTALGTIDRFIYEDIPPFVRHVDLHRGTFELADDGTGTFTVQQIFSTVETGTLIDVSDDYVFLPEYAIEWGLTGSQLVVRFTEPGTPRTVGGFLDNTPLKHRTMNCP